MTPAERSGAIAIVQLRGDVDAAFTALAMPTVATGQCRLRSLAGVDEGLVARVADNLALLMPHGGIEIVRQLCTACARAGIEQDSDSGPTARFPEASSVFDAALLDTIARAASPRAVDVLLAQPDRWAAAGLPDPPPETPAPDATVTRLLDRLVAPPLIVAVGPSNVGKSTLLNRLAGRPVAITADEPGTTRDHVGALIDVDGVVVRYVDTPGVRADASASESAAAVVAARLLPVADLVLRLGDATSPPVPSPDTDASVLTVALRTDLGTPSWRHEASVSARTGEGLRDLARTLRRALVPNEVLASEAPWRFWDIPTPGSDR